MRAYFIAAVSLWRDPLMKVYFDGGPIGRLCWLFFCWDEFRYRACRREVEVRGASVVFFGRGSGARLPADALSSTTRRLIGCQSYETINLWNQVDELDDELSVAEATYVSMFGTLPGFRNKGGGSAVLAELRQGPLCLETGSPDALKWYLRRGFSVASSYELRGVRVWALRSGRAVGVNLEGS